MFRSILNIFIQFIFGDIYSKVASLKQENKRLQRRLRRIKKNKQVGNKERAKRMNRELSYSVLKATKDIGNTYQKMQDIKESSKRSNLQVLCETGITVFNKVIS